MHGDDAKLGERLATVAREQLEWSTTRASGMGLLGVPHVSAAAIVAEEVAGQGRGFLSPQPDCPARPSPVAALQGRQALRSCSRAARRRQRVGGHAWKASSSPIAGEASSVTQPASRPVSAAPPNVRQRTPRRPCPLTLLLVRSPRVQWAGPRGGVPFRGGCAR